MNLQAKDDPFLDRESLQQQPSPFTINNRWMMAARETFLFINHLRSSSFSSDRESEGDEKQNAE